jgi:hypothetical protein
MALVVVALLALAAPTRAEEPALPMLNAAAAFEWGYRHFRHSESSSATDRTYDADGFPSAALAAEIYPAAAYGAPFWQDLGLTIDYARALDLHSRSARLGAARTPPAYIPVDTSFVRYGVGLRYRMPLTARGPNAIVLGGSIGYGAYRFTFDESVLPEQRDLEVPRARYDLVRFGLDVRAPIGPVALLASAAFLHAFSVGALGNRTPTGAAEGVHAAIGLAVHLWRPVSVQASVQYAAMFFGLEPMKGREGDQPGSVVDSYVTLSLGPVISL